VNETLVKFTSEQGIELNLTAPHSPSQNGVMERMNCTLVELACTILVDSKLLEFLWEPTVKHTVYLWNLAFMRAQPESTPYQAWHNIKLDVTHLHEFSVPVWVLNQGLNICHKMLSKSEHRAYISYNDRSKAIKYYNTTMRNILTSWNYKFLDVNMLPTPEKISKDHPDQGESSLHEGECDLDSGDWDAQRRCRPDQDTGDQDALSDQSDHVQESEHDYTENQRVTRGIKKDYRYLHDPFPDEEEAGIAIVKKPEAFVVIPDNDCCSLKEAKESPEWPKWETAIHVELDQLHQMGTWQLVEKPSRVVPITNKFVFTKKHNKAGNMTKYKARLVTKGCTQRPGFDYMETHSPIVCMETLRAILAIASMCKLFIYQLDIKGTYLNGILKECMYMKQPEGYSNGTDRICLLIKTLYGLKQAGREWNLELDAKLCKKGYMCLDTDPCIYIWHVDQDFTIITVWVDDLLIFMTTIALKEKVIKDVKSEWQITDLGEPTKIVRIKITRSKNQIAISLSKYIESILLKEGLGKTNSVATPLDPNVPIVPNPEGNDGDWSNSYVQLLGKLQYIANAT
jgi:hypothetical protein